LLRGAMGCCVADWFHRFCFFGAARIYPYTIYALFLRKKGCLTGFVTLGAAGRLVPFLTRERRFFFGIAAFLTELPFFPPHNEKSPRPY
jgi:hypothetical protein